VEFEFPCSALAGFCDGIIASSCLIHIREHAFAARRKPLTLSKSHCILS
jgi:hypothetical protein